MNIQTPNKFKAALQKEEARSFARNGETAKEWIKLGKKLKVDMTREELVDLIREGRK